MDNKKEKYELVEGYVYVNTLKGQELFSKKLILQIALAIIKEEITRKEKD